MDEVLKMGTDREIFTEVKKRDLETAITEEMDDEALEFAMKARGIWPSILEARPTRLIHELRHQAKNVSIDAYYRDEKKKDLPHSSDEVGADVLLEKMDCVARETRQAKKQKLVTKLHFTPKSVTDYT